MCQKIGAGKTPLGGKSQYVSSGIPLIREQNVHNNGLSYDGMAFITQETNQSMKGSQVFAKDLLMNITGGSIGRTALIIDDFAGGNVNQHVLIIRLINSSFRHFVHRVLHSDFILGLMFSKQTGDKPGLSAEKVNRFLIPIPPLAEQQRIVEQIETLLNYVDIIDTDAETLEKSITLAKQKILDLAIRGKLVPQDPADEPASELLKKIKAKKDTLVKAGKIKKDKHESYIFKSDDNCYYWHIGNETRLVDNIPFQIPDSWEWCKLEDIALLTMGQSPAGNSVSENNEGIEFHQGKIYFSEKFLLLSPQKTTEPTRIAPAKSVLICVRAPVGTVNINPRQICIGRGLASATPLAGISADFLFYLLNARKSALVEQATGSTFISVTGEQIKELLIPLPPLAEQEKIVSSITQYETILKSIQE